MKTNVSPLVPAASKPVCVLTSRSVYGQALIYPVNTVAGLLCQLTGKKTFSPQEVELICDLGFEVRVSGEVCPALQRFPRSAL